MLYELDYVFLEKDFWASGKQCDIAVCPGSGISLTTFQLVTIGRLVPAASSVKDNDDYLIGLL